MKKFKRAMEIGCGDRNSSELLHRTTEFDNIYLIEPNKILYHDVMNFVAPYENVAVGNFAIGKENGSERFYHFGYCSFLESSNSFLKTSCEPEALCYWVSYVNRNVETRTMSSIDLGDIDYLILTNQGSEMFVLDDMISRPQVIRTKYYCHNAKHWEYYNKVTAWMQQNGYQGNLLDRNEHGTFLHIEFVKK
jgi:hypothetical protein